MPEPYDTDLAAIHDAGFGQLAAHGAETLIQHLRRRGHQAGRVLDLGCGSGIAAEKLLAAGFDVHGIDISPAMIQLARRRAPKATMQVGSLWDADLPESIGAAAIGEGLNYLCASSGRFKLEGLLRRLFKAVLPGGVLLLDVATPARIPVGRTQQAQHLTDDWAVQMTAASDGALLTRQIATFRRLGRHWRRHDETHTLRLFSRGELVSALRGAGFRVQMLARYGSLPLSCGHLAVAATKPR